MRAAKMDEYLISLCSAHKLRLNGNSKLQHFKHDNTAKIHNGIMFNFYPGQPYMI